jgi:metallo-beta-lactamase family protein
VEGKKNIKIFNETYVVNAQIETLGGFSAHAGQQELIEWVANFDESTSVALVHGDAQALEVLSQKLWDKKHIATDIPHYSHCIAF